VKYQEVWDPLFTWLKDQLNTWNTLMGFVAGVFSVLGVLRVSHAGLALRIRMCRLNIKLRRLREKGEKRDKGRLEQLEILVQEYKLYLPSPYEQATAITDFVQLGNMRSFLTLARRLGKRPELDQVMQEYLIRALGEISRGLKPRPQ